MVLQRDTKWAATLMEDVDASMAELFSEASLCKRNECTVGTSVTGMTTKGLASLAAKLHNTQGREKEREDSHLNQSAQQPLPSLKTLQRAQQSPVTL